MAYQRGLVGDDGNALAGEPGEIDVRSFGTGDDDTGMDILTDRNAIGHRLR